MLRQTNKFAVTNSKGEPITVIEWTEFTPVVTRSGTIDTPGRKVLKTEDGRVVSRRQGDLVIEGSGEVLKQGK